MPHICTVSNRTDMKQTYGNPMAHETRFAPIRALLVSSMSFSRMWIGFFLAHHFLPLIF